MGHDHPILFTSYASKTTLQAIQYIDLRITLGEGIDGSGRVWLGLLTDLLKALDGHSLVQFKVTFRMKRLEMVEVWLRELDAYKNIMFEVMIYNSH
jgi:hypothetical protein